MDQPSTNHPKRGHSLTRISPSLGPLVLTVCVCAHSSIACWSSVGGKKLVTGDGRDGDFNPPPAKRTQLYSLDPEVHM